MILVTYASAHGSTAGIAERIARRLRDWGHAAVASPVGPVGSVTPYEAVILGSAIHSGTWLPEAETFARNQSEAMSGRPVWLFSVGSVGSESSFFGVRMTGIVRRAQSHSPQIAAVRSVTGARGHHAFAGAIRPGDWSKVGNLLLRAFGGRPGDHRNWAEVDAWADSIVNDLRKTTAAVA